MFNLYSCGFAYEKRVAGTYYIIGVDTDNDLGLSYSLGAGDYAGKAPGRLVQFGFNHTFLVAKNTDYKQQGTSYYINDMTKNSGVDSWSFYGDSRELILESM